MNVGEMVEAAHRQAYVSGFWDDLSLLQQLLNQEVVDFEEIAGLRDALVAQKLALISTEVMEFETAKFSPDGSPLLEELADVVIRTFDLAGFLDIALPEFFTEGRARIHSTRDATATYLYREIAHAVQSHRKGHHDFALHLENVCFACQDYATYFTEDAYALRRAAGAKMLVNETRSYKHGSRY